MAEPKIDLREPIKTLDAPTRPVGRIGPLKPGTILTRDTPMSEDERANLRKKGITFLPRTQDIPEHLQKKAVAEREVTTRSPDGKGVTLPEPVDIKELDPKHQADILKGLEGYQVLASGNDCVVDLDPAQIDLRQPEPVAQIPEPLPAPVPSEVPPSAIAPKPDLCPHCGWEQSKADPGDPVDTDKLVFLQATLGQIRFTKAYTLLDGRMSVTFRTLLTEEADMCITQTAFDTEAGLVVEPGQYFRTVNDYRMCLGLAHLDFGQKKFDLPELSGYMTDELPARTTKLKKIVPYVYDQVLKQEPIRRAVGLAWYRFQRLVEHLENHLDDKNFWRAIEGRPL